MHKFLQMGTFPRMTGDWKTRLKDLVDRHVQEGGSLKAASLKMGLNETGLRDLLRRTTDPGVGTLTKAADFFDVSLLWLVEGRDVPEGVRERAKTLIELGKSLGSPILNRGRVAAGVWREPATANQEEPEPVPIPRDPRYPHVEQYSLEVEGESVNRVAKNGWRVVCVPYWEARRDMVDGDLVHVERQNQADQREYTLKRLKIGRSGPELWPESSHPDHREPIPVANSDGFTVEIVGLVIGVYNPNP